MSITSAVAHAAAAAAAAGAGKKAAQVQLQAELNTDDEWNKFLLRDGLLVIDVYTEWCGPCLGMVGNLKKIKVEIGGDNLHLAVAKADTIECLKRFRNRSEPTWMFIAGGQLLNVVFGADAPRLARTIEQELKNEEQVRQGARERPQRAPHELTPPEQEVALAQEQLAAERRAREAAAAAAARAARRAARATRLEAHFPDVCPALLLPHAQKHLRKVADALEPYGVIVADKYPLVLGKDVARSLAAEEPELGGEAAAAALAERPALALVLKKLPDREGNVIELTRKALFGDGVEVPEGEAPKKYVSEELRADGVPGLFAPADREQRAAALDLLFPKMVGTVVEPPEPVEPPHVAVVFGAWQRRAVLAAAAKPPARLLRYGFFADTDLAQPRLLCKNIDKYEERVDKDYCETIVLMVAVGVADDVPPEPPADPLPPGPPAALLALGPLHVSEDAVAGAEECARFFPPGYSAPEHTPKPKPKKKRKKRQEAKENDAAGEVTAEPAGAVDAAGGAVGDAEGSGDAGGDGEGEGDGDGEAEGEGEGEAEGEGGSLDADEDTHQDKATSPPPNVG